MTVPELREKLKEKLTKLEKEVVRFNDLHRKAKYLKKQMVVTRQEIDAYEKQIESANKN